MWEHGGWDILPPVEDGPEESGAREPLVPKPAPPTLHMMRELNEE